MHKTTMLVFVFSFVLMIGLAFDLYLPSLPAITTALNTSTNIIQLTMTLFLLGYCIGMLICGPLADHYGRRPILMIGLALFTLASIACALAVSAEILIISRLVQGLGVSVLGVIWRTMLRDHFSGRQLARATTYVTTVWTTTPLVAPVLGSYLQHHFSWHMHFFLLALLGAVLWVATYIAFAETKKTPTATINLIHILKSYLKLATHRVFVGNILVCALMFGVMMAFNTVAPFLFQNRLGITTVHYGWLILLISSGYIFGGNFNNFLLKIFQAHKVLITSLILILTTSLIMLLFALSHIFNIYVVAIPMFLVFFAFNMAYPICAAGAMDPFAKQAGVASALSTFTIVLGGLIGSAWIAILPEQTQLPLATIILIAGSGSLLGYLVITPKYNNFSIKEKT